MAGVSAVAQAEVMQASGGADSFLLNLLSNRAERKDTRVFAHATAETQTAINDTYAGSRPVSRAPNISINTQEPGFLEVFPKVTSRPPRLLQELESILIDRLRCADKAAWPGIMLPKDRDPGLASNLSLDAHRQVFAAFIQGFQTYSGLLAQIQAEFEHTLAEGLRCTQENVMLRIRMAEEAQKRQVAQQEVRNKIMTEEFGFRRAAFAKLQETRERTARLSRRAAAAERELERAREEQSRYQKVVNSLRATSAALTAGSKAEKIWNDQPTSSSLQYLPVGPLNEQDRQFLESEYVTSTASRHKRVGGVPGERGEAGGLQRNITLHSNADKTQ